MNRTVKKPVKLFGMIAFVLSTSCISTTVPDSATATSLALKVDELQIETVESEDGDLYRNLLHHGPAVENLWVAYRIYFNNYLSVDILSKFEPRLELAVSKWYGSKSPELAARNFGKDNYKVGKTVGLGGIRLWDPEKGDRGQVVFLDVSADTKSKRAVRVKNQNGSSSIILTNSTIPYQGELLDIDVELTVFDGKRHALINVEVKDDKRVQFVTGLVIHDKLKAVIANENYLLTWGNYDSPAADAVFDVGAGLVFNPEDIAKLEKSDEEMLLVTKPLKRFRYLISSANEKELSGINDLAGFTNHIAHLSQEIPASFIGINRTTY